MGTETGRGISPPPHPLQPISSFVHRLPAPPVSTKPPHFSPVDLFGRARPEKAAGASSMKTRRVVEK
ncbi:hypothetical protein JZ751_024231 [Albula glossodonta]|uniref:Uncharacterized protein n=1 Tax=Albula glossodonta TaxID=121402 RepID=A0A8T2NH34_9TELE|nr:hypothetical protein JZ751_024231 [Albula glossodonta]